MPTRIVFRLPKTTAEADFPGKHLQVIGEGEKESEEDHHDEDSFEEHFEEHEDGKEEALQEQIEIPPQDDKDDNNKSSDKENYGNNESNKRTTTRKRKKTQTASVSSQVTTGLRKKRKTTMTTMAPTTTTRGEGNCTPPILEGAKTAPPLPIDGKFETWLNFGDNRGYGISGTLWNEVVGWVGERQNEKVWMAEQVAFHRLIVDMKTELGIKSARDFFTDALPKKYEANYYWATLMLMIATPAVPDTKIIEVFQALFKNDYVTEEWTINQGKQKLQAILKPLGRQNMSAEYILEAAKTVSNLKSSGIDLRDHRLITKCKGVGFKVALVTTQEAFGFAQGIPCDVHMCRMFTLLGWVPPFGARKETSLADRLANKAKKDQENHKYEAVRAAMEGWFPYKYWAELNQTWAGLGQLLNIEESRSLIVDYIDKETSKMENKKWRQADRDRFGIILDYYIGLKRS